MEAIYKDEQNLVDVDLTRLGTNVRDVWNDSWWHKGYQGGRAMTKAKFKIDWSNVESFHNGNLAVPLDSYLLFGSFKWMSKIQNIDTELI